jgi:hypothetical protein
MLVGKPDSKSFGRPRRRWENDIKADLKDRNWEGLDWIDLPQERQDWPALINSVMNIQVP